MTIPGLIAVSRTGFFSRLNFDDIVKSPASGGPEELMGNPHSAGRKS